MYIVKCFTLFFLPFLFPHNRILDAIENVVGEINITNSSEPVVIAQNSFAVLVQQVDLEELYESSQAFSVNIGDFAPQNTTWDDLSFGINSASPPTGSIQLPSNLLSSLSNNLNDSKIAYAVFVTDSLFLRRKISYQRVGSIILSASVVGVGSVSGLKSPVNLSFQLNPVRLMNDPFIMYSYCLHLFIEY